ncbi:hypothetical protein LZ32DRAFT_600516 [Colletotrichum eremochloae]|nr:hypothetical protein LZ32DRAFT_600516 [Colletotrichum eremochloae]
MANHTRNVSAEQTLPASFCLFVSAHSSGMDGVLKTATPPPPSGCEASPPTAARHHCWHRGVTSKHHPRYLFRYGSRQSMSFLALWGKHG